MTDALTKFLTDNMQILLFVIVGVILFTVGVKTVAGTGNVNVTLGA